VHAAPIEGEVLTKVKHNDVTKLMTMLLNDDKYKSLQPVIMTSLAKVAVRDPRESPIILPILEKYSKDMEVETQKRAHEYRMMLQQTPELRDMMFEHMPPPEAPKFVAADTMETLSQKKANLTTTFFDLLNIGGGGGEPLAVATSSGVDLLNDLLSGAPSTALAVVPPSSAQPVDILSEMLGEGTLVTVPPRISSADALADLMSGTGLVATSTHAAPSPAVQEHFMNLHQPIAGAPVAPPVQVSRVDAGSASSSTAATTSSPIDMLGQVPASQPPPVYTNGALSIHFTTSKPNPSDSGETLVTAHYVNAGPGVIERFTLQAAVPKSMTLTMQAASGSTLRPNVPVTQRMTVTNAEHGVKPIALRLKLSWVGADGQSVSEMATVNNVG